MVKEEPDRGWIAHSEVDRDGLRGNRVAANPADNSTYRGDSPTAEFTLAVRNADLALGLTLTDRK
jgi:hypothetical protein